MNAFDKQGFEIVWISARQDQAAVRCIWLMDESFDLVDQEMARTDRRTARSLAPR